MNTEITPSIIASSERKIGALTGGIHPEENKHQSTTTPITASPIPATLVLPLSQHVGSPAESVVNVGDKVLKGQLIARANGFVSAPIHAPSSGIVVAIEKRAITHPSGLHDICIVIDTDGEDRWIDLRPIPDYSEVEPEQLIQLIRDAGISGMGGAGFPTSVKLTPRSPIKTLILNGTECEPYITADDMLMREYAAEVIAGADILRHVLKASECLIGVEDNKPEAIAALQKAAINKDIEIIAFPTIYPSGGEKQLIQILTGKEVPTGRLPADLGMVVQNVGTAVAVHDAIYHGKPLISRITTLTGKALTIPRNVEVLLGTQAKDLLPTAQLNADQLATLVVGGPMMGFEVDNLNIPVTKTTNCLIAGTVEEFPEHPPAQACIRCGLCAEACPSSLLPQQLFWHAKAENHDQLLHHNLFDCIECGACSYVCPSSIPLVQYYRASKGTIRTQEAKHAKAERSKVRYEARLERLEKEKAEKEAKRKANAERAAKLKAAKAKAAAEGEQAAPAIEDDPIKAAIARAKAKKAAANGSTTAKPTSSVLSTKQKELKIQLSMAKAQLKKSERALATTEKSGEGDTDNLKANIQMLTQQIDKLQKEYDSAAADIPAVTSVKPKKPVLTDEQKRQKIELAMAKAALKKAERALATAVEQDNEATDALRQAVDECRAKVEDLTK
ncbi:electron transport complex subunit RsxC [Endozoicomonas sp. (ex Bugula neritina AB1)]|nr:electron transport complex subunit RsxC [Endozoicomonas sp. (ex Bugula neritina AB1)]